MSAATHRKKSGRRSEAGLTLVEMIVALAIGLVLMGGAYQLFASSTGAYLMEKNLSRMQENTRFALDFLSRDIRMAGYMGCLGEVATFTNTLNNSADYQFNFGVGLEGFNATGAGWSPSFDTTQMSGSTPASPVPLTSSDILTIRTVLLDSAAYLTDQMPDSSADLKTNDANPPPFTDEDIVLVTDCEGAAVFQVTQYNVNGSKGNLVHNTGGTYAPGNATKNLGHPFGPGSEIARAVTLSYYVAMNAENEPALYKQEFQQPAQEVVSGVESMHLRFGVDTNGDRNAESYQSAAAVSDWNQVVSVRLGLLMRSPDSFRKETDTATYDILGDVIDPVDDRRVRKVYTTTVGIRNKLP